MKYAGQAWAAYKNNLLVQDIVETAVATLGIAGAQALFTEMSPEEIAISGALGVGAAAVGRPVGDRVGRMIGKAADERFPEFSNRMGNHIAEARQVVQEQGGAVGSEMMEAKLRHHYDVPGRGPLEGVMSIQGRHYGDNVAQGLMGLAAPIVLGRSEEEGAQK